MKIEPWMRDMQASGGIASPAFQGPGKVAVSVMLPTVHGIEDPRFVATCQRETGETVTLPQIVEGDGEVVSGFYFQVQREALGPTALEITVERTADGGEPSHWFSWFVLRGPDPPREPGGGR